MSSEEFYLENEANAPAQPVASEITNATRNESQLSRQLSSRHLLMIAMGSSIGVGLWDGSGMSLGNRGSAALFLGYCVAGSIAWSVNQCIGEMAIMYPIASAFPQWTRKLVDVAPAFAMGWAYLFSHSIILATELQGQVTALSFWTKTVPTAVWLSIFFVITTAVNVCAVKVFGEIEVVMSTVKFFWIFVVIISSIVISAGGTPTHEKIEFKFWDEYAFTNGFKGFLSALPTCIFAIGGTEISGLAPAEARNPKKSGPLMVTIPVSPKDKEIFGASGSNSSPFVIAYKHAGLPVLAHFMNAIIFISVLSSGNAQPYIVSRTAVGLSQIGLAPKWFQKCDGVGRPWFALLPTILLGGGLSYLNVSQFESILVVLPLDVSVHPVCTLKPHLREINDGPKVTARAPHAPHSSTRGTFAVRWLQMLTPSYGSRIVCVVGRSGKPAQRAKRKAARESNYIQGI